MMRAHSQNARLQVANSSASGVTEAEMNVTIGCSPANAGGDELQQAVAPEQLAGEQPRPGAS